MPHVPGDDSSVHTSSDGAPETSDTLSASYDSSEERLGELSCGLPLLDDSESRPCRACHCTFTPRDQRDLGAAWEQLKAGLRTNGYFGALPSMDAHFKNVFMLHMKDWQGRLDQVYCPDLDYDLEYEPSEESLYSSSEESADV